MRIHERLIFLPVIGALAVTWGGVGWMTWAERSLALEQATGDLQNTIVTLADFNELAEQALGESVLLANERRADAMWRALLRQPTATIWFESGGTIEGGEPPAPEALERSIEVYEQRGGFVVHAAMPRSDALLGWRHSVAWRTGILFAITAAFLILTAVLARAVRQRAAAEREAATVRERQAQLERYRVELERTVAERTDELKSSNVQLEKELADRLAAEAELRQHDALLHSVTSSAAELLGSHSHEEAIAAVLELIARTIGVARVQINEISTSSDGHLQATIRYEWCAPGTNALIDHPEFKQWDLTSEHPRSAAALAGGGLTSFLADEVEPVRRGRLEKAGIRSVLRIPVSVEGDLWGSIDFIDASAASRKWNWAETDTLETLAGLIGAAITRARYVQELADANMIVQNSPTVLYRVRGEPPFPLIYVSHNITKYGHDPDELIDRPDWVELLMEPDDESRLRDAMARTLDKGSDSASIELRLKSGSGAHRWVENRYTPVRDRQGRLVEIEGMIIDITERKAAEEKIAHLARTDALTNLANRATFIERIRQAFHATRRGAPPFAIHYIDLDHFKPINDTFGHPVGDKLLQEAAERLRECTRENDVVARLGGDEFAVLQADVNEPASAGTLAAKLQSVLSRTFTIDGNDLHVTASIGICPYDDESRSPDGMLTQADLALYRSKEEGRNRYRFHSDDLDEQVLERVTLSDDLRRAVENDELELHYQPQVEIKTNRIVGVEAFVRWHHPGRGLLSASAFVPVAEKTGSIVPLGRWVLEHTCRQIRSWKDRGVDTPVVTMNLSMPQLKNSAELIRDVREALAKWNLDAADISFDVTEAMLAQVTLMRNNVLGELRGMGIGISIDNFGSEYSSLDYLRTYHVNNLKITSEFMVGATFDPERATVVRAIINFARELGIGVVTEGVETEDQFDLSSTTSIVAQGHFFSRAVDAEHVEALLRQGSIDRLGADRPLSSKERTTK